MAVTNFEFYKDEIKAVEYRFGLNKKGEIVHCERCECKDCILNTNDFCSVGRIEWLYEEHKEQPKLTKKERKLCEVLSPDTYIAKDKSGSIYAYSKKPNRRAGINKWYTYYYCVSISEYIFEGCKFSFIKWEDEEPWKVSDLLKLEVMDND